MGWFDRHSQALQAIGALLTAAFAALAIVGVLWQLDAQEDIAQRQTAHTMYRDFLTLAIQHPQFAEPGTCPDFSPQEEIAYAHFLEYTLYTAERVTLLDPAWDSSFEDVLSAHAPALCAQGPFTGYTEPVQQLISKTRTAHCPVTPACS